MAPMRTCLMGLVTAALLVQWAGCIDTLSGPVKGGSLSASIENMLSQDKVKGLKSLLDPFLGHIIDEDSLVVYIKNFIINELIPFPHKLSDPCRTDLKYWLVKLLNPSRKGKELIEDWSIRMLDSFGKPPSGILSGNYFWLGSFDECLNIDVKWNDTSSKNRFVGEYCLLNISAPSNIIDVMNITDAKTIVDLSSYISLFLGVCFPSTCTFNDKKYLMDSLTKPLIKWNLLKPVTLSEDMCQTKGIPPLDATAYLAIVMFASALLVVLTATLVDFLRSLQTNRAYDGSIRGLCMEMFVSFSAIRSLTTLFKSNETSSELSAMHGLRVLSLLWIIMGHINIVSITKFPWRNQVDVLKIFDHFILQPFGYDTFYSVTTFFTISGFLISYLFMQQMEKRKGHLNVFGFYLYRYIRLTPPYVMVLVFLMGPYILLGQGPIWKHTIGEFVTRCHKYWWTNLLYINSFYQVENQCYIVSWYLSADTLLYMVAPLFLYPLYRRPMVAFLLVGLFLMSSVIYTMTLMIINDYQSYIGRNIHGILNGIGYLRNLYSKPWHHFPSYVIGMVSGYFLYICEKRKYLFKRKVAIAGWIVCMTVLTLTEYGKFPYFKGTAVMGPVVNVINGVFSKPAWALCISWIIFSCATGNGGPITRLLSLGVLIPMSRLTYSAYLVHYLVVMYNFYSVKDNLNFSYYNTFLIWISTFMLTWTAAGVLAILIEFPILEAMKQAGKWYYDRNDLLQSTKRLAIPFGKVPLYLDGSRSEKANILEKGSAAEDDASDASECEYSRP